MTSATERNDRIARLFRYARQKYSPVPPVADRKLLEHLIYSCLLEDATFEAADEVFARLQLDYFDWNEVRVTTTLELAEVMKPVPDPEATANRLRRSLHGMFEAHYAFDLEFLKKENLGKAIETVGKYRGMTPFTVAYITQHALGGHAIPLDSSMMNLMVTLGIVEPADVGGMKVTGLERVISKNQGIEFASVVHQLAVAWRTGPFSNDLRSLLKKIAPDAADRFPKRGGRGKAADAAEAAAPAEKTVVKAAPKTESPKKAVAKPAAGQKKATPPAAGKKAAPAGKKPASPKPAPGKKPLVKKAENRKLARKKPR